MTATRIAYVLDFDGTITETDITSAMARHYGGEHYPECSAAYRRGEFGMKVWLARMSAFLPPDRGKLLEFAAARDALRPGFQEFLEFARSAGRPVYLASDGFGLYIEPILEQRGLQEYIDGIFRNHTTSSNGRLETLTPHAHEGCPVCGNCKAAHVIDLQEKGYRVIYVGDGRNDRFGAAFADGVYARDRLARICAAAGLPFRRWEDFHDLIGHGDGVKNRHGRKFCDPRGKGLDDGEMVPATSETGRDLHGKEGLRCYD